MRQAPDERGASLMLDIVSRVGDVVGEAGMRSLLQYAAAEVAGEMWARLPPPRELEPVLRLVGPSLDARIELVARTDEAVMLRVRTMRAAGARARDAILTGLVQGIERKRSGRSPKVSFVDDATGNGEVPEHSGPGGEVR